jgi:hypothetical protein
VVRFAGREPIAGHLLQHHNASNSATDFLVACSGERVSIDRITQGKLERDLIATWIGHKPAFEAYQKHYHSNQSTTSISLDKRSQIVNLMNDAFKAVIEDHRHPFVADFAIEVTSKPASNDGFRYLPKAGASRFHSVSNTTTPTSLLRSRGVGGGSFHYTTLVPAVAGVGAVAVYLLEGKVGVFFYPAKFWSPAIIKDVATDEFCLAIQQPFGVKVDGFRLYETFGNT